MCTCVVPMHFQSVVDCGHAEEHGTPTEESCRHREIHRGNRKEENRLNKRCPSAQTINDIIYSYSVSTIWLLANKTDLFVVWDIILALGVRGSRLNLWMSSSSREWSGAVEAVGTGLLSQSPLD